MGGENGMEKPFNGIKGDSKNLSNSKLPIANKWADSKQLKSFDMGSNPLGLKVNFKETDIANVPEDLTKIAVSIPENKNVEVDQDDSEKEVVEVSSIKIPEKDIIKGDVGVLKNEDKKETRGVFENNTEEAAIIKSSGKVTIPVVQEVLREEANEVVEVDIEKEKGFERELAEKWVEKWLPYEVLDEFALFYEKSRKNKEKKRKNSKYKGKFKKAQEEYVPTLTLRLDNLLTSGLLNEKSSDKEVKGKIIEMLKSDMHVKNMIKAINGHNYENTPNVQIKKDVEKLDEKKVVDVDKEVVQNIDKKPIVKKPEVSVNESSSKEELSKENEEKIQEIPETEKEFFRKYEKQGSYLNPKDGSELQILRFDPDKKEVAIYRHKSFVYDSETESWGAPEQKGGEEILKYDDFIKLVGEHISDIESGNEYFKEQQIEAEKEKTEEEEKLGGIYVKDNGDYFKQKEYQKIKGVGKFTSREGAIELEFDPKIKSNKRFSNIENLNKFIEKEGFEFYKDEEALKDSFWEEFGKFEDNEKLEIKSLNYNSEKGRYLAKIKEKEKESRLVTVKELREMIKKDQELSSEKVENQLEKLNEMEQKVVEIFERYIEDYREAVGDRVRENTIIEEDTRRKIEDDYVKYFVKNELAEKITSKLETNGISGVSQKKILEELKNKTKLI